MCAYPDVTSFVAALQERHEAELAAVDLDTKQGRAMQVHLILVLLLGAAACRSGRRRACAWLVILTADGPQESLARALKFIQYLAEIYWPYTNYQVSPVFPLSFSTRRCFTAVAAAAAS